MTKQSAYRKKNQELEFAEDIDTYVVRGICRYAHVRVL